MVQSLLPFLFSLVLLSRNQEVLSGSITIEPSNDLDSQNNDLEHPDPEVKDPSKRENLQCSDFATLPNLSFTLGWQYSDQSMIQNISTTAGTSETVTERIHHILHTKVPGLDGEVAENVVERLQRSGCLSIPFGEFVRDQFLRAPPSYLATALLKSCIAYV